MKTQADGLKLLVGQKQGLKIVRKSNKKLAIEAMELAKLVQQQQWGMALKIAKEVELTARKSLAR